MHSMGCPPNRQGRHDASPSSSDSEDDCHRGQALSIQGDCIIPLHQRTKKLRHMDVQIIRRADLIFDSLMNYRYQDLQNTA